MASQPVANNDALSLDVNPGSPRSPGTQPILFDEKAEIASAFSEKPLRFIIDPEGALTHDETTVDVVTIPCPGGDPLRTWNRDGLISRYFGAPSMRYAEVDGEERLGPSWVRQGIRREESRARVLLYDHPVVEDGMTLEDLAERFLSELQKLRDRDGERPLLLIGHSLGGLVAKMALVKASREERYEGIFRECYGLAFFGTPHQGSSYFAMPTLTSSIQSLLKLTAPLPLSITSNLRVGNVQLLRLDEDFKSVSNDLTIWTFYETIDSRLSGSASGDVYFTAPLASIKSAILGMRQESIFPLQSDHANIASFGRHNVHTLDLFLRQLAAQVRRAHENAKECGGCSVALDLEQKATIEIHGFFGDHAADENELAMVRAWSTKLPLKEFLAKGPEQCLSDRLNEVEGVPEESRFLTKRGRTSLIPGTQTLPPDQAAPSSQGLGIKGTQTSAPASPIIRPVDSKDHRTESAPAVIPLTKSPVMPSITRHSTPIRRPSPLIRAGFEQEMAIDRLSPPMRPRGTRGVSRSMSLGSDGSRFEYRDFPPFSQRSRSSVGPVASDDSDDDIENSPRLPEGVLALRKVAKAGKRRTSETVIVDEPAAFAKPEVQARKFLWLHLPFNNPTWVKNIFETLQKTYGKDMSSMFNHDFWATRHSRGRHSQHYAYFAKPGCYFSAPRTLSPRHSSPSLSPNRAADVYTCLFLPYLHFDSYKRLIHRREMIIQRLGRGRARPIPANVAKSDSLELQVIWEFLGHDPPINCRRTLDQYGYPSLRDTRSRDDDQMLYKLTKERNWPGQQWDSFAKASTAKSGSTGRSFRMREMVKEMDLDEEPEIVLNGNVLMVDQLWLWAINSHTILTFFPKRESDPIEGPLFQQADLRDSIFNEVNVDLTRQCDNAYDLAALAALHAVSVLLDRSSHPDLEIFRIFEEAISVLNEKLTNSLKIFRAEGFRDKASDYSPVEQKERSIRARHREEGRRAERDNRDNTSALLELRDLEDELQILLHLFERQHKVITSMQSLYSRPELRDLTINGRGFLSEALKRLGEYAHQADEMIRRVRSTRDDYDKLLQMVQRQAQVDEVRLSRLHADLASAQSRSVMIFTVFTVIFLPLTFFTGLFGMNTREWAGGTNLPLRTIWSIVLPASAALIVSALIIAWSNNVRKFFTWISELYNGSMHWVYITFYRPAARKLVRRWRRRQQRKTEGTEDEKRLKKESSDFWERHRLERDRGYQIPVVNRKGKENEKSKK